MKQTAAEHPAPAALLAHLNEVVLGQEDVVRGVVAAFLAGGHVLLTGAPGVAKTTLIRTLAAALGLPFGRIQFTPDLMPSDITGGEILNVADDGRRGFEFVPGPLFTHLLLADEINRASPRTQAALLEAMAERQVTAGGKTYPLPASFSVFATQNPFESEGTFPLPEAQLDRFLVSLWVDYPGDHAEQTLLQRLVGSAPGAGTLQLAGAEVVPGWVAQVAEVQVRQELLALAQELVASTRPGHPLCPPEVGAELFYGAGPRATLALVAMARAWAALDGRRELGWGDVEAVVRPVLRHRLGLRLPGDVGESRADILLERLLVALRARHAALPELELV